MTMSRRGMKVCSRLIDRTARRMLEGSIERVRLEHHLLDSLQREEVDLSMQLLPEYVLQLKVILWRILLGAG